MPLAQQQVEGVLVSGELDRGGRGLVEDDEDDPGLMGCTLG